MADIIPYISSLPFTSLEIQEVLAGQLGKGSIAMYARDVKAYSDYAHSVQLDPLDPQTLMTWRDHLALHTTMSPNTINRMLSAVRRVMKEAGKRNRIDHATKTAFMEVDGVKIKPLKDRLKQHSRTKIIPEDMRVLCELPNKDTPIGLRNAALLATLASSAIRVSELATLTWKQIKKQGKGYILLVCGKTDTEYREAYLSKEAHQLLMKWKKEQPIPSSFIFTFFSGNRQIPSEKHLSETGVWKIIVRYAEKAGLQNVKPHDFRRFVGTQLSAIDIRKAQKALGHKSIETTARHYVLDELEPGLTDNLY